MKENRSKMEEFQLNSFDLAPSENHKDLKHNFDYQGGINLRSKTYKQILKDKSFDVKKNIKDMDDMFSEEI